MGRELCLFTTVDASKAPAKQRRDFTALAVRRVAPFLDPDFDAVWFADGTAAIWYWSRARVAALAAGEPGKRKRFVAEALYLGQSQEQAIELLAFTGGIEARAWTENRLQASRYWPQLPTIEQWRDFLRGAGKAAPASSLPPQPQLVAPADAPWNRVSTGADKLQLSGLDQYLPKAALGMAVLFLLVAGFQSGSILRAEIDIWRTRAAAADLDAPLRRILDAREATDNAMAEIDRLLTLRGGRAPTSLMAEFTRLMPGKEWQVKKWSQPTGDTLEVEMLAPGSNPEELVSSWEASPMFSNVTTELGRNNELTIKATITPASAQTGDKAP